MPCSSCPETPKSGCWLRDPGDALSAAAQRDTASVATRARRACGGELPLGDEEVGTRFSPAAHRGCSQRRSNASSARRRDRGLLHVSLAAAADRREPAESPRPPAARAGGTRRPPGARRHQRRSRQEHSPAMDQHRWVEELRTDQLPNLLPTRELAILQGSVRTAAAERFKAHGNKLINERPDAALRNYFVARPVRSIARAADELRRGRGDAAVVATPRPVRKISPSRVVVDTRKRPPLALARQTPPLRDRPC